MLKSEIAYCPPEPKCDAGIGLYIHNRAIVLRTDKTWGRAFRPTPRAEVAECVIVGHLDGLEVMVGHRLNIATDQLTTRWFGSVNLREIG